MTSGCVFDDVMMVLFFTIVEKIQTRTCVCVCAASAFVFVTNSPSPPVPQVDGKEDKL